MPSNIAQDALKAPLVVHALPVVVAEGLLVKVAEQVERLDADVCAVNAALQQRPEVLQPFV